MGGIILVVIGTAMATLQPVFFNGLGFFFGVLGCAATTYSLIIHRKATIDYNLSTPILVSRVAIYAMILMTLPLPLLDYSQVVFSTEAIVMVVLSCFCGAAIQITSVSIAKNSLATTYLVVANVKAVITIVGGIVVFHEPLTLISVFSTILTIVGAMIYEFAKRASDSDKNKQRAKDEPKDGSFPRKSTRLSKRLRACCLMSRLLVTIMPKTRNPCRCNNLRAMTRTSRFLYS